MSQVPTKIKDRAEPQSPHHEDVIEIEVEDDQLEISSWDQGRKKQKLIEIPDTIRGKALLIFPRGSQYFDTIRHNFLV